MPERSGPGAAAIIDAGRVAELIARERAADGERHPSSRQAFAAAGPNLLGGVPRHQGWPAADASDAPARPGTARRPGRT